MSSPPVPPARRAHREAAVVILGLATACALGWAGWLVGSAPDALAEAEVASTARVVAADIETQWSQFRSGAKFLELSDGRLEALGTGDDSLVPISTPEEDLQDSGPSRALRASMALLLEAERLVVETGDLKAAREALDDAVDSGLEERDLATRRLVELRLAVEAHAAADDTGDDSLVNAWEAFTKDVDWSQLRRRVPIRLIGAWSAVRVLPEDARAAFRDELVPEGAPYLMTGTSTADQVRVEQGSLALQLGPDQDAAVQFTDRLFPGFAQELRGTNAWRDRLARRATWEAVHAVDPDQKTDRWSLWPSRMGLLADRSGADAFLVDEVRLEERILDALAVPEGFFLGLAGSRESGRESGGDGRQVEPLLRDVSLAGGAPALDLYHRSPQALKGAVVRQRRLSGWLLASMGALALGGALLIVRMLRRERRLAELRNTFVAGVSHDLRSPLASILLMADNLKSRRVAESRVQEYASGIASEAERLRRRVDDILDFARIERGEAPKARREEVRLGDLVAELHGDFSAVAARAGFRYEATTEGLPPAVEIDADALRRIAGNLVENALKHSGGTVVHVSVSGDETQLVLMVEDDGGGIPRGRRRRVLRPYERLHAEVNPKGGTGLGLAIVASLVDALGGSMEIQDAADFTGLEGNPGRGVRFRIELPLSAPPSS